MKKFNQVPLWTPLFWHRKLLYKSVVRLSKNIPDGSSLLDVGCGSSPYREILETRNIYYTGADIDSNNPEIIKIDPVSERIMVEDEAYDVVSHFQVMEHVPDFSKFLDECRRVLKTGGLLIATIPFAFEFHPVPSDYRRWTHEGLKFDFTAAGFEVIDVGPVENDWSSLAVINQLHCANIIGLFWGKPLYLICNIFVFFLRGGPSRIPLTNWIVCRKSE